MAQTEHPPFLSPDQVMILIKMHPHMKELQKLYEENWGIMNVPGNPALPIYYDMKHLVKYIDENGGEWGDLKTLFNAFE